MIRVRCHTCRATAHVGDDGDLPVGWCPLPAGGYACPGCGSSAHQEAPARAAGPFTDAEPVEQGPAIKWGEPALHENPPTPAAARRWRPVPFPASPCPDCGEPVRWGLGCFCRPGDRP